MQDRPTMNNKIVLDIQHLTLSYGEKALFTDFSLQLHQGEIICIAGPSGCGKTSLLGAILGFTPIQSGRILLNELELKRDTIDAFRREIAWIPQELALPNEWVKEMVQLPFGLKANRNTPFDERDLLICFEQLGLEKSLYYKRVNEVSGGQRQRMMIAVASMLKKSLTIVDEPTSALDSESTHLVVKFLENITKRGGGVLAVSHDQSFCDGCHKIVSL